MICYCKQEIAAGERRVYVTVLVDWGADDLREGAAEKHYVFHSFECLGLWAADRAAAHVKVTLDARDYMIPPEDDPVWRLVKVPKP